MSPPAEPAYPLVDFRDRRQYASASLVEDLAIVAARVHAHTGVEPMVADLTRPPHFIPVVKVVTPRLRYPHVVT